MKFYGRPFSETTKANAGKLELALALFHEKLIHDVEKALRLDTPLFRAFHNFSNGEIQAGIEEAKSAGSDTVVLEASTYSSVGAEAEAADAAYAADFAKRKTGYAPAADYVTPTFSTPVGQIQKSFPGYTGNVPAPASVPTSLSDPGHPFFTPAAEVTQPVPAPSPAPVPTPPPSTATAPQVGAAAEAAAHAVEAAPVKNPFSTLAGEAPQPGSNEPTN